VHKDVAGKTGGRTGGSPFPAHPPVVCSLTSRLVQANWMPTGSMGKFCRPQHQQSALLISTGFWSQDATLLPILGFLDCRINAAWLACRHVIATPQAPLGREGIHQVRDRY